MMGSRQWTISVCVRARLSSSCCAYDRKCRVISNCGNVVLNKWVQAPKITGTGRGHDQGHGHGRGMGGRGRIERYFLLARCFHEIAEHDGNDDREDGPSANQDETYKEDGRARLDNILPKVAPACL